MSLFPKFSLLFVTICIVSFQPSCYFEIEVRERLYCNIILKTTEQETGVGWGWRWGGRMLTQICAVWLLKYYDLSSVLFVLEEIEYYDICIIIVYI